MALNVGKFFSEFWTGIGKFFIDLGNGIKDVFDLLFNFFGGLLDFFIHLFIPTEAQWSDIKNDYSSLGDTLKNHIPFAELFSEELKKAQATVSSNDFLVINIPSFNFSGGGINLNTSDGKYLNVSEAYAPYRTYIRGFLFLVVVGLAFVYVLKHVLNLSSNGSDKVIDSRKGSE